jgi:hypothetical protein
MTETMMKGKSARYLAGYLLRPDILRRLRSAFQFLLRASETPRRHMCIEEQIAIGPKKMLMLVNCAGRRFLFAVAGDSITPFVEVRPPIEKGLATTIPVIGYVGEKR